MQTENHFSQPHGRTHTVRESRDKGESSKGYKYFIAFHYELVARLPTAKLEGLFHFDFLLGDCLRDFQCPSCFRNR